MTGRRWILSLIPLGLFLLAGAQPRADEPPGAPGNDAADKKIYETLRDVINTGADLYNNGDHSGCYRLYAGALMTIKPFLDQHPALQKDIDDSLQRAEQTPQVFQRAFVLREAMDKIRTEIKGDKTTPPPPPVADKGEVKGEVTLDGKPLTDGEVVFHDAKGEAASGKIGPGGEYSVKDLKVGTYKISVIGKDVAAKAKNPATSGLTLNVKKGSNTHNIQLKKDTPPPPPPPPPADKGSVKGVVTLDGKPVARGDVVFVDDKGGATKAKIEEDGSYTVKDLKVGSYKVAVTTEGAPARFTDAAKSGLSFDVKKGDNGYNIALKKDTPPPPPPPPGRTDVEGKVTLDGKPLAAGSVFFHDKDNGKHEAKVTDGSYATDKLKAGDYKVAISGKGVPAKYGDAQKSGLAAQVKGGKNSFDFALKGEATPPPPPPPPPPARDEGTVKGKAIFKGKALTGAAVFLVDEKGGIKKADVGKDGEFSLTGVPVGKYKVAVDAKDIPSTLTDPEKSGLVIDVKKGETVLDLDLK